MPALRRYLVGDISSAPTCVANSGLGSKYSRSTTGMTNASVFPDPVTACIEQSGEGVGQLTCFRATRQCVRHTLLATRPPALQLTSTHTSLFCRNRGIVADCTGVMVVKPSFATVAKVEEAAGRASTRWVPPAEHCLAVQPDPHYCLGDVASSFCFCFSAS